MTHKQKSELAFALLESAANMLEQAYSEDSGYYKSLIDLGIPEQEARQQIANWLRHLPGNVWHNGLPQPAPKL